MKEYEKEFVRGIGALFLYWLMVFGVICLFMLFAASITCSVMLFGALLRGQPVEWYMIVAPIVFCLFVGGFIVAEVNG